MITILQDNDSAGHTGGQKVAEKIYKEFGSIAEIGQWDESLQNKFDVCADDEYLTETKKALQKAIPYKPEPIIRKGYKIIKMTEFKNQGFKLPQVIVRNLIEECQVTILGGSTGIGKSFMALQFGCSIATGIPMFGYFEIPEPRKVLLIQFELMNGQLDRRFKVMEPAFSDTPEKEKLLAENFEAMVLTDDIESYSDQWGTITNVLSDGTYDEGVVIVDNLYTSTSVNVSDNYELTDVLTIWDKLKIKHNVNIMVVAHNNKGVEKLSHCIDIDWMQGGAMLSRSAGCILQIAQSKLSNDLRVAKITKVRDEKCNLLNIPFKLYWDEDTFTFNKGSIIQKESLHFIETKERWEIKLLKEMVAYSKVFSLGNEWSRDEIWAYLEAKGWEPTSHNKTTKLTRFFNKLIDWGAIKRVKHNTYIIIGSELLDD